MALGRLEKIVQQIAMCIQLIDQFIVQLKVTVQCFKQYTAYGPFQMETLDDQPVSSHQEIIS